MIEIILPGEVPSKKNSRINTRSGRSFPSAEYRHWHDGAVMLAMAQAGGGKAPVPCRLEVSFTHGTKRRRDSDNGMSSVLDMLVDAGILPDDSWREVRGYTVVNGYEKDSARCVIRIFRMDGEV